MFLSFGLGLCATAHGHTNSEAVSTIKYYVAGRTNPEGVQRTEGIAKESGEGCHTEMLESLYWLDLCYEELMLE